MVGAVIEQRPGMLLQLKVQLRDVHPAVWRRVRLADTMSIADLHRVIQLLMGWDDDHLHRFRIHGRDYGIAYVSGPSFGEDAAIMVPVPASGAFPLRIRFHDWLAARGAGGKGNRGSTMRRSARPNLRCLTRARPAGRLRRP